MHFQDTGGVGVKFPNYLQNPTANQSQTVGGGGQQSWADKNRAAFTRSLGLGGVTGDDGKLDLSKALGAAQGFCL